MEEEQEKKQTFLREEILEQNYDPQVFISFLVEKKGEKADDVNNWTFEELQIVVNEFKTKMNDKKAKSSSKSLLADVPPANSGKLLPFNSPIETPFPINNKDSDYFLNEETNNEWIIAKTPKEIKNNNNINSDVKIYEIECLEPDQSPLSKYNEIKIKISSPEKKYENTGLTGFFSKKIYFSFLLENLELKIQKRRKYTDFEWLRRTLCKLFPGNYIPPLPQKSLNYNATEKKINKYQKLIERFMNNLMEDNLIKNSSLLYLFLYNNDLISVMDRFEKHQKPLQLNHFYSRNGKIIIDESVLHSSNELVQIKKKILQYETVLANLNKSFKLLVNEMKQVSDRMNEISQYFKNIYDMCITNSESKILCKCYSDLELLFKEFSNSEQQQVNIISGELKNYFKYVNLQYSESFKEIYNSYEYDQNLFIKVSQQLKEKKEMLYNTRKIEEWQLSEKDAFIDYNNKDIAFAKMLPKDTAIVNEIKKHLIYYATQVKAEHKRLQEVIEKQNNTMINILYDKNVKLLKNLYDLWKLIIEKKIQV